MFWRVNLWIWDYVICICEELCRRGQYGLKVYYQRYRLKNWYRSNQQMFNILYATTTGSAASFLL